MNKKQRKKENRIPSIVSTGWPSYDYRGEIKYNKPHGKGKIKFTGPLLSIRPQAVILDHNYEGEFKKGKKDGMGTFINYHTGFYFNKYEYVGEFKDDKFHGEGTQTFPDGSKIIGQWKEGFCMNGHRIYSNGKETKISTIEIEIGMTPFDKVIIKDKLEENSCGLYEGETKNGKPHGKGRAFLTLKKRGHMPKGGWITWIGEWKDGNLDGKGTWIKQRGKTYDKYYYEDGPQYHISVFEGEWKKGLLHGEGILKDLRDHIYSKGEFKDDNLYNGTRGFLSYDQELDVFDKEEITIYHKGKKINSHIVYYEGENPKIDESEKN